MVTGNGGNGTWVHVLSGSDVLSSRSIKVSTAQVLFYFNPVAASHCYWALTSFCV